jgi:ferric-dicitrate binding protein FerR (iron transport regulator)
MAAHMARGGTVPETPEALDAWIAATPDARAALERDGYGRDFTSEDLLPLLHVFAGTNGAAARPTVPTKAPSLGRLILGLLLLVAVGVVFALLAGGARDRSEGPEATQGQAGEHRLAPGRF